MKNKILKICSLIAMVVLSAVVGLLAFVDVYGVRLASAETVSGSAVLDDLHIDESFDESNYPEIADDYSLNVIQIAETTENQLLIYVYQPSGQDKSLSASSINISRTINDAISYYNFKLTLLNSDGVFFKYLVNDLTVFSDPVRYYAISVIYRPFNEAIDEQAGNDNIVTEVNYGVNKQYCFGKINGNDYCSVVDIETIEITDKFVGLVRYSDGWKFYPGQGACDSHFVAFNTDKQIDKLLEADVYYTAQSYGAYGFEGDKQDKYAYLKYDQHVEHNGGGWFAGTYKWDRIETVEQFLSENDLDQNVYSGAILDINVANKITEEGKNALEGKQWLLRFTETAYTKTVLPGSYGTVYSEELTVVGEVTILRLKFETDGIPYNLGVIDNKQSGSGKPINNETLTVDFDPLLDSLGKIIAIIAFIAIVYFLSVVCPPIKKAFKFIYKKAVWLISLPFKFLSSLFKK